MALQPPLQEGGIRGLIPAWTSRRDRPDPPRPAENKVPRSKQLWPRSLDAFNFPKAGSELHFGPHHWTCAGAAGTTVTSRTEALLLASLFPRLKEVSACNSPNPLAKGVT